MLDRHLRHCLLAVIGFAGMATAAGTADLRLPEAARNQDAKAVRSLLTQKADVNARSSDGSTALLWLAHWNDADTADLLLSAGADANTANDFGMTPLSQACINGSFEFVRLLLKSSANPNTAIATGETPLMTCAKTGNVDAVRLLVEYGAAINAKEPAQRPDRFDVGRRRTPPGRGECANRRPCRSQSSFQRRIHGDTLRGASGGPGECQVVAGRRSGCEYPDSDRPEADWKQRGAGCYGWSYQGSQGWRSLGLHSACWSRRCGPKWTSRCICWIMAPIPISRRRALHPCIGRRPRGKATPRIRCTALKTPCPEFRIVRPSCGW